MELFSLSRVDFRQLPDSDRWRLNPARLPPRVDHSSSQHAVGSDQHGCIRCILDSRGNLQKVGLRNLRHRLVLCDVQFVGQKVHRVLNGPAVGIGQRSKADDSHSKGADFKGEILREIPDCSECHADRRRERVP